MLLPAISLNVAAKDASNKEGPKDQVRPALAVEQS
jgi:hypothetical protein